MINCSFSFENSNPVGIAEVSKENAPIRKRQRRVMHDNRIRPFSISRVAVIIPSISFTITLPWKLYVRTETPVLIKHSPRSLRGQINVSHHSRSPPSPLRCHRRSCQPENPRAGPQTRTRSSFSSLACFVDGQLRTRPQYLSWRRLLSFLQKL